MDTSLDEETRRNTKLNADVGKEKKKKQRKKTENTPMMKKGKKELEQVVDVEDLICAIQ